MGHVALYRQFRSANFDEIVEQKHVVAVLRQSVISGQIGHAYLFSGTRGTGKTSIAKIFSRAINCLNPQNGNPCNECEICRGILDNTLMDVIEMDAASNNSVDNIRRVCDEVMFLPTRAKYKVYIVDEVHMLSGGAFNALLKTLEEPPAHAVFILATTEPHRIPATILSRCQRYDFRRIPLESMVMRLRTIADVQHTPIDEDALVTISNLSDGALRDAISLLDQVSTGMTRQITRDDVLKITGVVDDEFLSSMANALLSGDSLAIVTLTEELVMDGRDIIRFTLDLARYFRDVMVVHVSPNPENLVQATTDSVEKMRRLADRTSSDTLIYAITRLSGLVSELKWSPDMRTSFEIALLSFSSGIPGSANAVKNPNPPVARAGVTAHTAAPAPVMPSAPTSATSAAAVPAPAAVSIPAPAPIPVKSAAPVPPPIPVRAAAPVPPPTHFPAQTPEAPVKTLTAAELPVQDFTVPGEPVPPKSVDAPVAVVPDANAAVSAKPVPSPAETAIEAVVETSIEATVKAPVEESVEVPVEAPPVISASAPAKSKKRVPPPPIDDFFRIVAPFDTGAAKSASGTKAVDDAISLPPPPEEPDPSQYSMEDLFIPDDAAPVASAAPKVPENTSSPAIQSAPEVPVTTATPEVFVTAATLEVPVTTAAPEALAVDAAPNSASSSDVLESLSSPSASADTEMDRELLGGLWETLLHKWEDTLFLVSLQMKHARIDKKNGTLSIVFPDIMGGYADSLTGQSEYKKISEDIRTVIPGITEIRIGTDSQQSGSPAGAAGDLSGGTRAAKPDWAANIIAFSESTGIPVETLENL